MIVFASGWAAAPRVSGHMSSPTSHTPASNSPESVPPAVTALAAARQLGAHRGTFAPRRTVWRKLNARRLHLFTHGIVVSGAEGPKAAFRYDAMTMFREAISVSVNGVRTSNSCTYTFLQPDGSKVKVDNNFAHFDQWGAEIQQGLVDAQFPAAQNTVAQGGHLRFDNLTIDRNGVTTPKGTASWFEIQRVDVDNGVLVLGKLGTRRDWYRQVVSKIPNFYVAYYLMRQLKRAG